MVRAPHIISFVLAVCCSFRHNAAIPLDSHSITSQMRDTFKEKKTDPQNWNNTVLQSYATRETELSDVSSKNNTTKTRNLIYHGPHKKKTVNNNENQRIRNINLNINSYYPESHEESHKDEKKGPASLQSATIRNLEDIIKKEHLVSCVHDKKKNQRYSTSFIGNATNRNLSLDKEFEQVVGNNSKAKSISSVHEGEDITLCWIETMTIKEDKTVQPPKRLVIREYTISFENSATIPDRYLECKRLEGELVVNDPEIGKTALFEVIDEDTKVSKVVNFTSISHVGDVIVWQHKRVKCGVGPVVSKNIMEWNDGSDNPKKRVEIKISPKMHKLTTKSEEEPCTESSEEEKESSTSSDGKEIAESSTSYLTDTTKLCKTTESGTCEVTTSSNEITTRYHLETGTIDQIVTELPVSGEMTSETTSATDSKEEFNVSIDITESSSSREETASTESIATEGPFVTSTKSDELLSAIKEHVTTLECENPTDPMCEVRDVTTSLWESSTELSPETSDASETSSMSIMTISTPTSEEAITKEIAEGESSSQETLLITDESFESIEDIASASELATKGTSFFTPTTVFEYDTMKTLEPTPQSTSSVETSTMIIEDNLDHDTTTSTVLEAGNTTSPGVRQPEEEKEDIEVSPISIGSKEDTMLPSTESTSERSDKVDYTSLDGHTVTSSEIDTEQVVTETPSFIEFAQAPGKFNVFDKLSVPIENITEPTLTTTTANEYSIEHTEPFSTIEFLSTSEEVPAGENESEEDSTHKETTTAKATTAAEGSVSTISTSATVTPKMTETESSSSTDEYNYGCENSEDCIYASQSEMCTDSGECSSKSCESGLCSEEGSVEDKSKPDVPPLTSDVTSTPIKIEQTPMIDLQSSEVPILEVEQIASTTAATLISEEGDKRWTAIDNVPTTVETRRSTPLSVTTAPGHKLILKVKVLLEHVNEKKEKENLVEVEKQLSLDENAEHHEHADLLRQLKSFNDSISAEAINALLNCTSLGNLTRNVNLLDKRPTRNNDNNKSEKGFTHFADSILKQPSKPSKQTADKDEYPEFDQLYEVDARKRRRRDFLNNRRDRYVETYKKNFFDSLSSDLVNPANSLHANSMRKRTKSRNTVKKQGASNAADENEKTGVKSIAKIGDTERNKMAIVRQALPQVAKDVSIGLQDVMSQLRQHELANDLKKVDKLNLIDIIAPKHNRFHSRRKRAAMKEIAHWSNERIRKMPMGDNLRSFTELVLYNIV